MTKNEYIEMQKKIIADMRESGLCVGEMCNKLSLMDDDRAEKDTIDSENIHFYYELMNVDDLEDYGYILNDIFEDRQNVLAKKLNINLESIELLETEHYAHFQYTGLVCFGVKDVLKPIDDFVAEITESEDYRANVSENVTDTPEVLEIRFLQCGLVTAPKPEGFDSFSNEEQEAWATKVLDNCSDKQIIEATYQLVPSESQGDVFDQAPQVAAIETEFGNEKLFTTSEWESYIGL